MTCATCRGALEPGWLCEEHPARPWGHDGCGGAGRACICNPTGAVQWREVFAETPSDDEPQ